MGLMDDHRDGFPIVPDREFLLLLVDGHFDLGRSFVSLHVVRGVHKDFVKDFVKRRHVRYFLKFEFHGAGVDDPHLLGDALG